MKKLLLILLFIPLVSFGQCECVNGYDCNWNECGEGTTSVKIETKVETEVNNVTRVARPLVLSDEKTTIKTPLTADLSNYTHMLLVDYKLSRGGSFVAYGLEAGKIQETLSLSVFEIMNPFKVDKKRARKELNFLKTIKNESYLYLQIRQSKGRGDDVNTTFIIRDWKNKIIYNATHINTGLNEILAPLIDY